MTLKSWREEFMPKMPSKRLTKIEAIEHSLRKWKGLTKSNLNKHEMEKIGYWISGREILDIDSKSCALCVKYYEEDELDYQYRCKKCPLFQTLGKRCDFGYNSPYSLWTEEGNPRSMIRALEKTLKREMEKSNES